MSPEKPDSRPQETPVSSESLKSNRERVFGDEWMTGQEKKEAKKFDSLVSQIVELDSDIRSTMKAHPDGASTDPVLAQKFASRDRAVKDLVGLTHVEYDSESGHDPRPYVEGGSVLDFLLLDNYYDRDVGAPMKVLRFFVDVPGEEKPMLVFLSRMLGPSVLGGEGERMDIFKTTIIKSPALRPRNLWETSKEENPEKSK